MGRNYNHPLGKDVDLNIGQRVEMSWGGSNSFFADVTSVHAVDGLGNYTVQFVVVSVPDKKDYTPTPSLGMTLAWSAQASDWHHGTSRKGESAGNTLMFARPRGKPYIPGVDPPRAMGARKVKAVKPKPFRITLPISNTTETMNPDETVKPAVPSAEAMAGAIAAAITEVLPSRDDIASAIATGIADEASKMSKSLDETLKTTVTSELKAIRKENDKLVKAVGEAISSGGTKVKAKVRAAVEASTGKNIILDKLTPFYTPGHEAPANVLVASPPSFGKSYSIRLLGEMYDLFLEHGCSDDMDEIATLLGSPTPDGTGGFVIVDGVLTEAMRAASAGKNVLLLLDEVLRLTPRAQEWLLTFLTGVKVNDGSRKYRLRTRRPMPDGTLEVIECPSTNLHIVGATNLSILNPIEAFWSRWETVRVEFTVELAEATGKAILVSYGISGAVDKLAKQWAGIVKESRQRVADGKLRFPVDFRILERAAACTTEPTAKAVAKFAGERLSDNVANWNPDTGDVDASSQSAVVPWVTRLAEV